MQTVGMQVSIKESAVDMDAAKMAVEIELLRASTEADFREMVESFPRGCWETVRRSMKKYRDQWEAAFGVGVCGEIERMVARRPAPPFTSSSG